MYTLVSLNSQLTTSSYRNAVVCSLTLLSNLLLIRHGQLADISYVLVRIRVITSSDASTFCMLSDAHYDKSYPLFQVIYPLFATFTAFKSSCSKFSIRHGGIHFRVIKICSNYGFRHLDATYNSHQCLKRWNWQFLWQ